MALHDCVELSKVSFVFLMVFAEPPRPIWILLPCLGVPLCLFNVIHVWGAQFDYQLREKRRLKTKRASDSQQVSTFSAVV